MLKEREAALRAPLRQKFCPFDHGESLRENYIHRVTAYPICVTRCPHTASRGRSGAIVPSYAWQPVRERARGSMRICPLEYLAARS
jgi:hypothetical protein